MPELLENHWFYKVFGSPRQVGLGDLGAILEASWSTSETIFVPNPSPPKVQGEGTSGWLRASGRKRLAAGDRLAARTAGGRNSWR